MVEYKLGITFLQIFWQCQKILWHFEIFTWELMGKPKMWNILKTADCRVKLMKIWDSGCYSTHMEGTFDAQFLDFGLGSFRALCKISDSMIFETLLLQQFSYDFNQTSNKVS